MGVGDAALPGNNFCLDSSSYRCTVFVVVELYTFVVYKEKERLECF